VTGGEAVMGIGIADSKQGQVVVAYGVYYGRARFEGMACRRPQSR
jgi:hypothetical protein